MKTENQKFIYKIGTPIFLRTAKTEARHLGHLNKRGGSAIEQCVSKGLTSTQSLYIDFKMPDSNNFFRAEQFGFWLWINIDSHSGNHNLETRALNF